jgi:multiple sugar transport system substrate-binding protein
MLNPLCHSIFTAHQGPEGGQGLPALADGAEAGRRLVRHRVTYYQPFLHAYDDAPMWKVEPRNLPYRDALKTAHLPGWPAPLSRAQSETIAKFVIIDMFAKACAGKSTKEVIADAQAQLKQIYKQA